MPTTAPLQFESPSHLFAGGGGGSLSLSTHSSSPPRVGELKPSGKQQQQQQADVAERSHRTQSSEPDLSTPAWDSPLPARKRRRTVSEGSVQEDVTPILSLPAAKGKGKSKSKGASSSANEPESKGTWIPAAVFIFLSHILVFAYAALYLHNRYVASVPSSAPTLNVSGRMVLLTLFSAWLNLLGITAGYHRLWSHNSYRASTGLRVFLAIIGLCSFQGSARWWVQKHRLHHRFTDTENDPYDSTKGLWYSHIGWLFEPPPYFSKQRLINMRDLDEDWGQTLTIVCFQKRYLLWGYILFGFLVPGLVGLMTEGSFWVGVLWIGVVGRFLSWHCIWTINSLSHWEGYREFSLTESAVYVALVNLLQNGEGHHNHHHAFPIDYRHGHRWYEWDPTKWFINTCAVLGMATELKTVPENEIKQAQTQVLEQTAALTRSQTQWGPSDAELPRISEAEFVRMANKCKGDKIIFRLHSDVLDVTGFHDHIGGRAYLQAYHGRDITSAFEGTINLHTSAAASLARMYRVAIIEGYREFSLTESAVYVALVNLLQNSEGHHNHHHAFPIDYRHGHRWYEWDPTKWFINT